MSHELEQLTEGSEKEAEEAPDETSMQVCGRLLSPLAVH